MFYTFFTRTMVIICTLVSFLMIFVAGLTGDKDYVYFALASIVSAIIWLYFATSDDAGRNFF